MVIENHYSRGKKGGGKSLFSVKNNKDHGGPEEFSAFYFCFHVGQ